MTTKMSPIEEIFEYFALTLIDAIPSNVEFEKAVIEIERQPGMAGYRGYYIGKSLEYLMPDVFRINVEAIHDLHKITSQYNNGNNNWNKATFILFPDKKFDLKFEFDEEWQNEVDRLNKN